MGCTLALLLRAGGRSVRLAGMPARGENAVAARPIALSYASRIILERAGAWHALAVTPIEAVHVSQAAAFGRTRMSAADAGVPALGYVIDYRALTHALTAQVRAAGIGIAEDAPLAPAEGAGTPLVVHAEGGVQDPNEKRYDQTAVVALVGSEPRAEGTAYERFTAEGPLALLPLAGDYGVVWAMRAERAVALLALPPQEFLSALQAAFGRRAGRFVSVEARAAVPLALRVRASRIHARQAYAGNSAQTLHPVGGQGLNLGLRDAWALARAIGDAPDPGDPRVLDRYAASRRADAFATIRVTDLLAGLFVGANPLARTARGAALCALDLCAPARRFLARRMIYGPSAIP